MEPADTMWVPILLLALLGCFFLQKAVRPGARQTWSWGRSGGAVPLSRWGYASWAAALFSVAAAIACAPRPPLALVVVFFLSFLAVLTAGFLDTRRYNRCHRDLEHPEDSQALGRRGARPGDASGPHQTT